MHYPDKCELDKWMNPHTRNDIIQTIIYGLLVYIIFNNDTKEILNKYIKDYFEIQLLIFVVFYYIIHKSI